MKTFSLKTVTENHHNRPSPPRTSGLRNRSEVRARMLSRIKRVRWVLLIVAVCGIALALAAPRMPDLGPLVTSAAMPWLGGHDKSEDHDHASGHCDHDHASGHSGDDHGPVQGEKCAGTGCLDGHGKCKHEDHDLPLLPQLGPEPSAPAGDADHDHGACDHDHAPAGDHRHDEATAIKLSRAAQANVGIRTGKLALGPFERTIPVPAIVVERPGRSRLQVAAPLTGVVTRIRPLQGETVVPGQPLFDLRLTHEEVVTAQAEFLRTAEELDVVQRELDRLERIAAEGTIAGKTVLERKYEKQKLEAAHRAERQRLLLHGLSQEQVDGILAKRSLLSEITIVVPQRADAPSNAPPAILQVQDLRVENGQHVAAGELLCVLSDHAELYIEGKAFEQDIPAIQRAVDNNWLVKAVVSSDRQQRQAIADLKILYLANRVSADSRAQLFYVLLPNQLSGNRETPENHRFSDWQFKPGQRVEILVPVERWADRIVLPVEAVVQDGAESYVYEVNDGHFDRRTVRVEHRDRYNVVIANDKALTLGRTVVVSNAYQVHLALKNKAAGPVDPHAGHNH